MVPLTVVWGSSIVLGCLLGVGLWSILVAVPRIGAPKLADRLTPYLMDVSEAAREATQKRLSDPLPVLGRLLGPILTRAASAVAAALGGNTSVERWLTQSGSPLSVQAFRVRQVLVGLLGIIIGGVAGLVVLPRGGSLPAIALPCIGGILGVVLWDNLLRRRAAKRVARITEEVPTVLEFLSLTLSAGEGITDALRRVARIGSGELSRELRRTLIDTAAGVPVSTALAQCAARAGSPPLTRAVDHLTAAMEHGSPIADVLRAQAHDARDDLKRSLLEAAGRKEVTMLVPLVLLILPLSIAFALLPGLFVLRAGF
ncbi:type II secretion system F family protein [Paramicrobacterium sp. CJ85]|uniref:type II secretion system F family protein n=1 Tax=Paramicrobacterium sp. CJ85 TaxID=3445355 RepID=UPI003F5F1F78